jgi:hypothetical protein
MSLTYTALRLANKLRLPQFRNKLGTAAHSKVDGSDWTVAQWFRAWIGEIGEFAEARVNFERGNINRQEYEVAAAKELADAATYQDLLAQRALDETAESTIADDAQLLMLAIMHLGRYANQAKKRDRGEMTTEALYHYADQELLHAMDAIRMLRNTGGAARNFTDRVDPHGINLGAAVVSKFNEVSTRVGCNVFLTQAGDVLVDARRVGP